MASKLRVDELYDLDRVSEQIEEVEQMALSSVQKLVKEINDAFKGVTINLPELGKSDSIKGFTESVNKLTESLLKNKRATDELVSSVREYGKVVSNINSLQANDSYGKQKNSVVSYSKALNILATELGNIRQKIAEYTEAGEENSKQLVQLQNEERLLTQLVENKAAGIASATEELRSNEKALQDMAAAGLQSTEVYKQLLNETAKLKGNINSLDEEIGNLSSGTKTLDGLTEAAETLVDVYSVGIATADLFGIKSDVLQKQMEKLEAVVTILNGVQSIYNALQKESSMMVMLNAAGAKAAAAAQWLYSSAIEASTVALRVFKAALITTGLGAIVVAIGYGIEALSNFGSSTDDTKEKEKELNDEMEKEKRQLEDVAAATEKVRNARKGGLNDLNRELNLLRAKGASSEEVYKKEQEILGKELSNLRIRAAMGLDVAEDIKNKENEIEVGKLEFKRKKIEEMDKLEDEAQERAKQRLEHAKGFNDKMNTTEADANERIAHAHAKTRKIELESQKNHAQEIIGNDKLTLAEREEGLKEYLDTNLKLNDLAKQEELHTVQQNLDKIAEIEKKSVNQRTEDEKILLVQKKALEAEKAAITADYASKENDINAEAQKKTLELNKSGLDKQTQELLKAHENELSEIEKNKAEQETLLNNLYANGEISATEYHKRLKDIESQSLQESLQKQIDYTKKLIAEKKLRGEDVTELETALSKHEQKITETKNSKLIDAQDRYNEKLKELKKELPGVLTDAVNKLFDTQKERIDEQIQKVQEQGEAEKKQIEESGLSKEEKESRTRASEAKTFAAQKALEAKKEQITKKQAALNKSIQIGEIIANTAGAIMKNTKELGLLPAIPVNIATGVLGAVQLAKVLTAKAYADGTPEEGHPGGGAIVGDGGKPEVILFPDGSTAVTPALPTFLPDLEKGAHVFPSIQEYVNRINPSVTYAQQQQASLSKDDMQKMFNKLFIGLQGESQESRRQDRVLHSQLIKNQKDGSNGLNGWFLSKEIFD